MKRKIFALIISVIMMALPTFTTFAQTTVTDSPLLYVDITNYVNSDLIGRIGDTVIPEKWLGGLTTGSNFGGFFAPANPIKEFNEENAPQTPNGPMVPTGNKLSYKLNEAGLVGGVNDSILIKGPHTGESVVINNFSKRPVSKLHFAILGVSGEPDIYPVITYTDGTVDATQKFKIANYASALYGDKSRYQNLSGFASMGWNFIDRDTSDNKLLQRAGSATAGLLSLYINIDSSKEIKNVTFASAGQHYFLSGITQQGVSNANMNSVVDTVCAYTSADAKANVSLVALANRYADELVLRGVKTEAEVYTVRQHYQDCSWYLNGDNDTIKHMNISANFDSDTIAEVGDTIDPVTWFSGYPTAYVNNGGYLKKFLGKKGSDYVTFDEYSDGVKTTKKLDLFISENTKNGSVNDCVKLQKNAKDSFTVNLNNLPTDRIVYAAGYTDSMNQKAVVTYTDGTSQEFSIGGQNYGTVWSQMANYTASTKNGRAIGFAGANYQYAKPNASNIIEMGTGRPNNANVSVGMVAYEIRLDNSKIPTSITYSTIDERPVFYYSISQYPVSNDTMISFLESMKTFKGVFTKEDEKVTLKAANYVTALDTKHIVKAQDNAFVETFVKQAQSQKDSYVDLSSYLNADLMVKDGETVPVDYNGRSTYLYNSASIPADGIVTMSPPSDANYTSAEVGKTFKLNGAYNGVGNDVIKISANQAPLTINLSTNNDKSISVILDSLNVGDGTAGTVSVVVNYTDGTNDTVPVNLYLANGFNTRRYYAACLKDFGRIDINTGTNLFVRDPNVGNVGGNNPVNMYSADINYDKSKNVSSLTFNAKTTDYHILAMSKFAFTNQELSEELDKFFLLNVVDNKDITPANVDGVIKGTTAICTLYERGFTNLVAQADYIFFQNMNNYATFYKANGEKMVFECLGITQDASSATANFVMTNTTEIQQNYILLIAAYGANNKLLGINFSDPKVLLNKSADVKDSVSIAPIANATYKAFIWESKDTIKPLLMFSK